jgi:hypothetical protein
MITKQEFLEGEPLEYRGFKQIRGKYVRYTAVYRVGVALYIYRAGQEVCKCITIKDDAQATQFYSNQVRDMAHGQEEA